MHPNIFFQLNHHICGQLGGLTGGGNDVFGKVNELVILPYLYLQQPFNLKYTQSPHDPELDKQKVGGCLLIYVNVVKLSPVLQPYFP